MKHSNPTLSVVVIGRNEGHRLSRCLESVQSMDHARSALELIYVDSDSEDGSRELATTLGAKVIHLRTNRPCAALARNAGWREANAPTVLFLDGDTTLHPDFVRRAMHEFTEENVGVVWGHRRETRPRASWYNRVLDLDWVYPPGDSEFCGGDALIRKSVLEQVGGFDENLIAGEEPEMCARIRRLGHVIRHVDRPMSGHDLAIVRWSQYWRRALRAGYAYAQVARRFRGSPSPLWQRESRRNVLHGSVVVFLPILAALLAVSMQSLWPLLAAGMVGAALIVRTAIRSNWKSSDPVTLLLYGVHSHLQQAPILWGQLTYHRDRRRRRVRGLIDYKES